MTDYIKTLERKNAELKAKLKPAFAVRDAYMTQDQDKIYQAIENMRHVWNEIFISKKDLT